MRQTVISPEDRVFVLTGAGISAESGIRTFRDSGGLWEEHRVEDVASPEGFARDPGLVWRFYATRRAQAKTCAPNPAHFALASMQKRMLVTNTGGEIFLCTQNVDPLHEQAAHAVSATPQQVLHMHGELFETRCSDERCSTLPFADLRDTFAELPRCPCGALQRPHIVWFGEMPLGMDTIEEKVSTCDIFVTIGSSGAVYPAAGLVQEIHRRRRRGDVARAIYIGLERPENASQFDEVMLGKASELVPTVFGTP